MSNNYDWYNEISKADEYWQKKGDLLWAKKEEPIKKVNIKTKRKVPLEITIGSDPEFLLTHKNGEPIQAYKLCSNLEDEWGADGGGNGPCEIRPKPSLCPIEHLSFIYKILLNKVKSHKNILNYNWLAGSFQKGFPLGGHVHFGVKATVLKHSEAALTLDNYLGALCLLIEDKKQGSQRRGQIHFGQYSYGQLGDYRNKKWGFELRSLPSWMTNPHVAAAVLCLGKTIIHEMVNNSFEGGVSFERHDFSSMDTYKVSRLYSYIWDDITKMELYPKYKQYIGVFDFLIKNKRTWFSSSSMLEAWGLYDTTYVPAPKLMTLERIWREQNSLKTI